MNPLIAQMTGKSRIREDVPLVPGAPRSKSARERTRPNLHRRTAAAMLGLGEAEREDAESIIPDDAEEVQNITGPSGIRLDDEPSKKDQEPDEPDTPSAVPGSEEDQLLSPRDALVAPDVTPQSLEPIDASEVPAAKGVNVPKFVPSQPQAPPPPNQVDPMDVLLGRTSNRPARPEAPPENVVTAESAQATVNTLLNAAGGGGQALLKPKQPMPDPASGDGSKIMEAFDKYGPARTWNF